MPMVGFVDGGSADGSAVYSAAFHKGWTSRDNRRASHDEIPDCGGGLARRSEIDRAGTIIDTSTVEWESLAWVPPPMDAMALDQVTYDYMTSGLGYPVGKVRAGPGVVSKASPPADE
jgi:hypothetical protein